MTRTISTAILALALGLGTPVLAQENQLPTGVADTLTQYGYDLDPSLLTDDQLSRFEEFGAGGSGDDETETRRRIDEILVMDAGTSTYVSEEMRAMLEDTTQLEANARELLNQIGMNDVDVGSLSTEQLAQLWFLQESGVDGSDSDMRLRIQSILDQS